MSDLCLASEFHVRSFGLFEGEICVISDAISPLLWLPGTYHWGPVNNKILVPYESS